MAFYLTVWIGEDGFEHLEQSVIQATRDSEESRTDASAAPQPSNDEVNNKFLVAKVAPNSTQTLIGQHSDKMEEHLEEVWTSGNRIICLFRRIAF